MSAQQEIRPITGAPRPENVSWEQDCIPWQSNPGINPRTGNDLPNNAPYYSVYKKKCCVFFLQKLYGGVDILTSIRQEIIRGILDETTLKARFTDINKKIDDLREGATDIYVLQDITIPKNIIDKYKQVVSEFEKDLLKVLRAQIREARRQPQQGAPPPAQAGVVRRPAQGQQREAPPAQAGVVRRPAQGQQREVPPAQGQEIEVLEYPDIPEDPSKQGLIVPLNGTETLTPEHIAFIKIFIDTCLGGVDSFRENSRTPIFFDLIPRVHRFIILLRLIDIFYLRYEYYIDNSDKYPNSIKVLLKKIQKPIAPLYYPVFNKAFDTFIQMKVSKLSRNRKGYTSVPRFTKKDWEIYIYTFKTLLVEGLRKMNSEIDVLFNRPASQTGMQENLNFILNGTETQIKEILDVAGDGYRTFILIDREYRELAHDLIKLFIEIPIKIVGLTLPPSSTRENSLFLQEEDSLIPNPKIQIPTKDYHCKCIDIFSDTTNKCTEMMNKIKQKERVSITKEEKTHLKWLTKTFTVIDLWIQECSYMKEEHRDISVKKKALISMYHFKLPQYYEKNKEHLQFKNIPRGQALPWLYMEWSRYRIEDQKEFWRRYYNVTFKDELGIFLGPGRELMMECLQQISTYLKDLFIPVEKKSQLYTVNPEFEPSKDFIELASITTVNIDTKKKILEFIGGLFSRCVLYEIEIPFRLSNYTLSYLMHKEAGMSNFKYVLYYIMDMPEDAASRILSLLQLKPNELKAMGLYFNDYEDLVDEKQTQNKPVTIQTFEEYISLLARYMLSFGKPQVYKELLDGFYQGIIFKRQILSNLGIPYHKFGLLLNQYGGVIPDEQLKTLVQNIAINYYYGGNTRYSLQHQRELVEYFKEILLSDGSDFPFGKADIDAPPSSPDEKLKFIRGNFLPKLLYFWTSSSTLDTSKKYSLQLLNTTNPYPTAHTCSLLIDIPLHYDSKSKMFENIVYAVYHNEGFGFVGGSAKQLIGTCLKHAQKNCAKQGYNLSFLKSVRYLVKHKKGVSKKKRDLWIKNIEDHPIDAEYATSEKLGRWMKKVFT